MNVIPRWILFLAAIPLIFASAQASCLGFTQRVQQSPALADSPPPRKLSQTGIFSNLSTLSTCPGFHTYDVVAPFWSDGALKKRWIALPPKGKITFSAEAPWKFPPGTILVKHFELKLSSTRTTRLETRVILFDPHGQWHGFTYRWDRDGKDAELLSGTEIQDYQVADPSAPGGFRKQTWTFPSRDDCMRCHNPITGGALGVRTGELNFTPQGKSRNQLTAWNQRGWFDQDIGDPTQYVHYADPYDTSLPVVQRARSYLAVNCAQCHRPNEPVPTNIDLRFSTPLQQMRVVNTFPSVDIAVPGARILAPGDHQKSVIWIRMHALDKKRMPPLGSSVVDIRGLDLIRAWIDNPSNF